VLSNSLEVALKIIGGAVVLTAAAFAYRKLKHKKISTELNPSPDIEKKEKAIEQFIRHAGAFCGLYEPIFMIYRGRLKSKTGVFADCNVRINNLDKAEELIELWNKNFSDFDTWDEQKCIQKAEELLNFLYKCGVARDDRKEIIIDNTTYKKYATEDGELIELGHKAKVWLACWSLNDHILEKGIISKVE
jgi:hypothetical protein